MPRGVYVTLLINVFQHYETDVCLTQEISFEFCKLILLGPADSRVLIIVVFFLLSYCVSFRKNICAPHLIRPIIKVYCFRENHKINLDRNGSGFETFQNSYLKSVSLTKYTFTAISSFRIWQCYLFEVLDRFNILCPP